MSKSNPFNDYIGEEIQHIIPDDKYVLFIFKSGKKLRVKLSVDKGYFTTKVGLKMQDY